MLSKTAEYSLRAVASLADTPDTPISATSLAEQTKIPRRYLHRVLGDLTNAGIVNSRPGPGGGYTISVDINKSTILDVLNAVSPVPRIRECPLGLPAHSNLCPLHRELDRAYAAVESAFAGVTIADLLNSDDSGAPSPPLCTAKCG